MQSVERPGGVRVEVPEGCKAISPEPSRRRPAPASWTLPLFDEHERLAASFRSTGLLLADRVAIVAGAGTTRTRRRVRILVEADGDAACLLIESGGVYRWVLHPDVRQGVPGPTLAFAVPAPPPLPSAVRRRTWGDDAVAALSPRMHVLTWRFPGPPSRSPAAVFELHRPATLVQIRDVPPSSWTPAPSLLSLGLPTGRPPRILLLLHDTFTTTAGSFGPLAATPWGETFLHAALHHYDAVLGYDHPTVGEDPLRNALDLLDRFGPPLGPGPVLDVVALGRGGLVLRSLVEQILPFSPTNARVERVVFVGCPNAGSALAEPAHWNLLLDLHTNLAAATARAVAFLGAPDVARPVLEQSMAGVPALVRVLGGLAPGVEGDTEADLAAALAPGVAAMAPGRPFLRSLNEHGPGEPDPSSARYFAVTSDFEPSEDERSPVGVAVRIAKRVADRLHGGPNDLATGTDSMTAIDPGAGPFMKDVLALGPDAHVHHLLYLLQPEVVQASLRWLGMDLAADGGVPVPRQGAEASRAVPRDIVVGGGGSESPLPAAVEPDVLFVDHDDPAATVAAAIDTGRHVHVAMAEAPDSFRVLGVERARRALDVRAGMSAGDALAKADPELAGVISLPEVRRGETIPSGVVVVTEGGRPVGTMTGPEDRNLKDLREAVRRVSNPHTAADADLRRSMLPSTPASFAIPEVEVPEVVTRFQAAMPARVELGEQAQLTVMVSRDQIRLAMEGIAVEVAVPVQPALPIRLRAVAVRGFEIQGENAYQLPVPEPQAPAVRVFTLVAVAVGEAEVAIEARQDAAPLVTLTLKPEVAAKGEGAASEVVHASASAADEPLIQEPLVLSVWQTGSDEQGWTYRFELDGFGDIMPYEISLQADQANPADYVQNLYTRVEDAWVGSKDNASLFFEQLAGFGAELWRDLFPPELQRKLWEHRDQIDHIWLMSNEPYIPWEMVRMNPPDGRGSDESVFLAELGLIRWLKGGARPPPSLQVRTGRVRYVIPTYPDPQLALPETAAERAFLESEYAATGIPAHGADVVEALKTPGTFDLLHFSGHGVVDPKKILDAQLLLEGDRRRGRYVREPFFASVVSDSARLKGPDGNRAMVFLNACQAGRSGYNLRSIGGFAAAFFRAEMGAFVSTLWSVEDRLARTFVEEFYRQILKEEATLAKATVAARQKARSQDDPTWLAYTVYGFPGSRVQ